MIPLDLLPEGQKQIVIRNLQIRMQIDIAFYRAKCVLGESTALELLDRLKKESIEQGSPNHSYIIRNLNKACTQ